MCLSVYILTNKYNSSIMMMSKVNNMGISKGFHYNAIREFKHLNNRHMSICIRISLHLISHDNLSNTHKLHLCVISRYHMKKYLESTRVKIKVKKHTRPNICRISLRGLYSYVFRKLKTIDKYISGMSKLKKLKEFLRNPNVTKLHCERFKIPLYSTFLDEIKCRIIELMKYRIPNKIKYIRRKY